MKLLICIQNLFNKWAEEDGQKNIESLLPKPLDVDFTSKY